ncbi:MAG TPA: glycine oxidase ThiO [Solirubrobacteraceae bacterium]|nr:glycine oxidase ThiO [Solirubrobacteraceae bacterium]
MPNRSSSFDVAVVGAGVIGLAVAWRSAQRGLKVVVIDRASEVGSGTTPIAAGMIAPISEAIAAEQPLMRLGLASARAYPEFVAELRESSGMDPGFLSCGTLFGARDPDEAEALTRELALRERLRLPARRLLASEARRLEPALTPTLRLALEIPDDHAIDPRKLTPALAQAARAAGAELRLNAPVTRVTIESDRVTGVELADGHRVGAEHVVLAAGVWSDTVGGLPDEARVPIHPVKGQILRLHDPNGPGLLTHALRMTGAYLVPRGDGRYVLGATMEERGFDTTVTAGGVFELLRNAFELLPSITELVIDEAVAGLRPATPDNAPAIGRGAIPGLHWATGHFRHGILLTPITAEIMAAVLAGEDPDKVAPEDQGKLAAEFTPTRFSSRTHAVAA